MSKQEQVSRREFFERSAAAAGGVAVPWLIPSGLLAAPGGPGPTIASAWPTSAWGAAASS